MAIDVDLIIFESANTEIQLLKMRQQAKKSEINSREFFIYFSVRRSYTLIKTERNLDLHKDTFNILP